MNRPSPRSNASSSSRGSGRPTHGAEAGFVSTRLPYYRPVGGLRDDLRDLLEAVRAGTTNPDDALERLAELPYRDLGFARVDTHRELRQGAPEAILAEGKTPDQVAAIFVALLEAGAGSVLATRADDAARAAVRVAVPEAEEDSLARCVWVARSVPEARGLVAVVSAGTSDGPVVHEVRIRAELLGTTVVVHEDAGVAGVHRLATALPDLERADCVVVVAGMDGALASLVGGLARGPVIGVPTSVGYGSAHGGTTALNAMLASCAAGLAVVGIDDGLGAGTIAARIARGLE
jgi:NCAIR mutase (PurE)-related protein